MGKFDGKVLLELGSSVASVDIVKYAKSEGAYVIVADYLPAEQSEAKQYADETAMISTLDADALTEFAREKNVDGVFCGVSEPILLSVQTIAERLGLPCYFTKAQWDLCQNKAKFKALCKQYGVPVAERFEISDELLTEELSKIEYPVIVKPVDQGAGIGIHICYDENELIEGYRDAYEKSYSHEVIVEQYIVGTDFTAYYDVYDGEVVLSAMTDWSLNRSKELPLPIADFHIYPSRSAEQYLSKVNDNIVSMMKSIGFYNGSFFVQGIRRNNDFYIFEAGLRLAGGTITRLIEKVNGINPIHGMTNYALTGRMGLDISREDVFFSGKLCGILNIICRAGTIGKIEGVETVKNMPEVSEPMVLYHVGDEVPAGIPLRHRFMIVGFIAESKEDIIKIIEKISTTVKVLDKNGNSMVLDMTYTNLF